MNEGEKRELKTITIDREDWEELKIVSAITGMPMKEILKKIIQDIRQGERLSHHYDEVLGPEEGRVV